MFVNYSRRVVSIRTPLTLRCHFVIINFVESYSIQSQPISYCNICTTKNVRCDCSYKKWLVEWLSQLFNKLALRVRRLLAPSILMHMLSEKNIKTIQRKSKDRFDYASPICNSRFVSMLLNEMIYATLRN